MGIKPEFEEKDLPGDEQVKPDEDEEIVGRVGGQDTGYAGETGAERRAAAENSDG
jgi:hypothetical protein